MKSIYPHALKLIELDNSDLLLEMQTKVRQRINGLILATEGSNEIKFILTNDSRTAGKYPNSIFIYEFFGKAEKNNIVITQFAKLCQQIIESESYNLEIAGYQINEASANFINPEALDNKIVGMIIFQRPTFVEYKLNFDRSTLKNPIASKAKALNQIIITQLQILPNVDNLNLRDLQKTFTEDVTYLHQIFLILDVLQTYKITTIEELRTTLNIPYPERFRNAQSIERILDIIEHQVEYEFNIDKYSNSEPEMV